MTSEDSSWMPASGRHPGTLATKRANLPDRDFYSFRYNFKPESIDSSQPGTIGVKRGNEEAPSSVIVERSGTQDGERHVFSGTEQTANMECVCVLIFDEETGAFTLEKLDSLVVLTYDKKTASGSRRPSSSPLGPPPSRPSSMREPVEDLDLEAQLERDLAMDEDADGEPDDEYEEVLPHLEEEEIILPLRIPTPPPKPKPQRPAKPKMPPKMKLAPSKGKGKVKRDNPSDVEEERFEFGQSAQPAKRRRPSPPSEGLALPGTFVAPPHLADPTPVQPVLASDSEEEEDWDEVTAAVPSPAPPAPAMHHDIFMEEGDDVEEIDMNAFEAEMNEHLEDDEEDFLAAAVGSDPDPSPTGPPMSFNQLAGGEPSQDEDDYSSSDDSYD